MKYYYLLNGKIMSANEKMPQGEDYDIIYQVVCENRHTLSKYCRTRHRAICLWNNRVSQHSI